MANTFKVISLTQGFLVNITVTFYCSIFCQTTNFAMMFSPLGALWLSPPSFPRRLFQVNGFTLY